MGYIAYLLTKETRDEILEHFPPKFPRVIAEHITHAIGVDSEHPLPPQARIEIYGYACMDGIEALAVTVNGEKNKPDGRPYHITLSLDPSKNAPKEFDTNPKPEKRKEQSFKPVHSNALISSRAGWQDVVVPIAVNAEPQYISEKPPQPKSDQARDFKISQ